MATNKTQETDADVAGFVAGVADPGQRADADTLIALMSRVSGHPPKLWGPSIVGFGRCHYRYDSGREGDMPRIAFSPRKGQTVLYLSDDFPDHAELLTRLGKHKTGKACLYVRRLSGVDVDVLEALCVGSLAVTAERYPE